MHQDEAESTAARRAAAERIAWKLRELEISLATIRTEFDAFTAAPTSVAIPHTPEAAVPGPAANEADTVTPEPVVPSAQRAAKPRVNFEQLLAGKGLFIAGLTLIALAAAFFLKIAFDTWIGPEGRCILGIAAGAGIAYGGYRFGRGTFARFGDGIIALGCVVVLLSVFAATSLFSLLPAALGLFVMQAVVLGLTLLALSRNSEFLATFGGVGGLGACLLLGEAVASPPVEVGYIAALDIFLLTLAHRNRWRVLRSLIVIGTIATLHIRVFEHNPFDLAGTTIICLAFYIGFIAAAFRERSTRTPILRLESLASAGAFAWLTAILLRYVYPGHAALFTAAMLLAALAHLVRSRIDRTWRQARYALAAFAIAIAAPLHGNLRDLSLCIDAGLLYTMGCVNRDRLFRFVGFIVLCYTARHVFDYGVFDLAAQRGLAVLGLPFVNTRFLIGLAWSASALLVSHYMHTHEAVGTFERRRLRLPVQIAGHFGILSAVSVEVWAAALLLSEHLTVSEHVALPQTLLSLTWIVFAAAFMACGLKRRSALLRWESLALIAAVLYKLFTFDLASLDLQYRVVSAFVAGITALGIAAAYQRFNSAKTGVPDAPID